MILKTLLKIFGVLLLAVVFTVLAVTTGLSYYAVTTLKQIPQGGEVNPNLKEITRIGQSYMLELQQFEILNSELHKHKMPALCSTICNGSTWDGERFSSERATYLQNFYRHQKAQALQDPLFRLKLEELSFIAKAFPQSVRTLLHETLDKSGEKSSDKFSLTLRFEKVLLTELVGFKGRWHELKNDSLKLDTLRALVKSCRAGGPRKPLLQECRETFPN